MHVGMIGSVGGVVSNATATMIAAARAAGRGAAAHGTGPPVDADGLIDTTALPSGPPRAPRWRRVLRRFLLTLAAVAALVGGLAVVGAVAAYVGNRYGAPWFMVALTAQFVVIGAAVYAYWLED